MILWEKAQIKLETARYDMFSMMILWETTKPSLFGWGNNNIGYHAWCVWMFYLEIYINQAGYLSVLHKHDHTKYRC